jgi:hypothetical protein
LHEQVVLHAQAEEPMDIEALVMAPGERRVRFECMSSPRHIRGHDRDALGRDSAERRIPIRRVETPELHLAGDEWNQPLSDSQKPALEMKFVH